MSGAEILSLLGIIIGLVVLVVLVMKGINIYVVAFIASIIVAVLGRMNLYEALKTDYMASFASFVPKCSRKRQKKYLSCWMRH